LPFSLAGTGLPLFFPGLRSNPEPEKPVFFTPGPAAGKPSFAGRTVYLPLLSFGYTPEGREKSK